MNTRSPLAWFVGGGVTGIAMLFGFVQWGYDLFPNWPPLKNVTTVGPVAVSPRWSVILEEKSIHPYLAEYEYRLRAFRSERRDGEYIGTIELPINAGGRTFLLPLYPNGGGS